MIAVFKYTDEEIKQAILDYHNRKIDFSARTYKTTVNLEDKGGVSVKVESIPKEPKPAFSLMSLLRRLADWRTACN